MIKQKLGKSELVVPRVVHGLMRLGELEAARAEAVLGSALDCGIDFFDHANIYCQGESERVFTRALKALKVPRDRVVLQSKCGIHLTDTKPPRLLGYNFSYEHIIRSVEGILRRLESDYLDVLLLHRPDTLVEPEDVAMAFNELEQSGKVRHFGVSNFNPGQVELLRSAVRQPLLCNQLQFGPAHADMACAGFNVNVRSDQGCSRDNGILEYSRIQGMTIQAWSPLQFGMIEGAFLAEDGAAGAAQDPYAELKACLKRIGEHYGATPEGIAIAWILRHPARMQAVVGSMNPERIRGIAAASAIELTREEWYEIYLAGGNVLP